MGSGRYLTVGHTLSAVRTVWERQVRMGRVSVDKNSAKYREDRERNNKAVQKARASKREKEAQTQMKIDCLKAENQVLETRIKEVEKTLSSYRDMQGLRPSSSQCGGGEF